MIDAIQYITVIDRKGFVKYREMVSREAA